jgi:hypothetical protein
MAADLAHQLLFVAGDFGHASVYDTATGAAVAAYRLADPAASFVNDVTVTQDGAWFTDSPQASSTGSRGRPGPLGCVARRPTPAASSISTASPPLTPRR